MSIPLKARAVSLDPSQILAMETFAFELRRGGNAALLMAVWARTTSQINNTIADFALDFERKESVCGDHRHGA